MTAQPSPRELVGPGFARILGLQAWGATIGVGTFLTIDFGSLRTTSAGVTQGAFHLWVFGSSWDICRAGVVLANSEQDRATMMAGAHALSGASLRGFDFDPDALSLVLQFDADLKLTTRPLADDEMEEWLLYLDDGTVITAGPGKNIVRESASATS